MSDTSFTAVREDPSAFCMDWPVFDPQSARTGFQGRVFVLDPAGERVADKPFDDPGDPAADRALRALGWTRTDEWHPDGFGRPTARVERRVAGDQGWLPVQPIASLAEEASLHIG